MKLLDPLHTISETDNNFNGPSTSQIIFFSYDSFFGWTR